MLGLSSLTDTWRMSDHYLINTSFVMIEYLSYLFVGYKVGNQLPALLFLFTSTVFLFFSSYLYVGGGC